MFFIVAVPGVPMLDRLCTVVVWRPPLQPAGVIIGYEVRFQESSESILRFSADENFYITTDAQREINTIVQVGFNLAIVKSTMFW
jgi:hypothetical protein